MTIPAAPVTRTRTGSFAIAAKCGFGQRKWVFRNENNRENGDGTVENRGGLKRMGTNENEVEKEKEMRIWKIQSDGNRGQR